MTNFVVFIIEASLLILDKYSIYPEMIKNLRHDFCDRHVSTQIAFVSGNLQKSIYDYDN